MNVLDYFRTVRAEFSGLFSDSPSLIFKTVFVQSGLNFRDCFWAVLNYVEVWFRSQD